MSLDFKQQADKKINTNKRGHVITQMTAPSPMSNGRYSVHWSLLPCDP